MSLSTTANNLMIKLSFNLQPPFVSLPWLKRSVVRCFSHKPDGSELPVRYVPKKHRDSNQTQRFSSRDNAPKDSVRTDGSKLPVGYIPKKHRGFDHIQCPSSGDNTPKDSVRTSSSSSNGVVGHKTLDGIKRRQESRIDHEESSVSFDGAHGVDEDNRYGKKAVETKCFKTLQEVVEHMDVAEEVVQELQVLKRDSQSQGCKLNQENIHYDGVMDTEYMEAFEEDVDEMQLYEDIAEGKQERSKTCRTKQGAEKLAIQLLAKRAFTGVELRKKLTAKKFPVNVAEAVISDFQDRGMINDRLYAEMFSHSRWKSSSWAPDESSKHLRRRASVKVT